MAYTKQTWQNGDTITAEKLNHMEDGIDNSNMFYIELSYDSSTDTMTLDKTYQEIYDAFSSGKVCLIYNPVAVYAGPYLVIGAGYCEDDQQYAIRNIDNFFYTDTIDGYPSN